MKKRSVVGKLSRFVLFVLPIIFVFVSLAAPDAPTNIFPSNQWAACGTKEDKIEKIINKNFDLDDTVLHKVNVNILYNNSGSPNYLVGSLLSKTTYSRDTYRVNLHVEDLQVLIFHWVQGLATVAQRGFAVVAADHLHCGHGPQTWSGIHGRRDRAKASGESSEGLGL